MLLFAVQQARTARPQRGRVHIRWKRWLIAFLALVAFYLLMDRVVMPAYTRHGQAIDVPDVTNMTFETARSVLEEHKLKAVKGGERFDSHVPPGYVLFQEPPAGSKVKTGRRIYLTLSKGERTIAMPNLVGGSERDAVFKLNSVGLAVDSVEYDYSSYYPDGVVADQSIPPGTEVAVGTKVRLTVSLGPMPSEFIVPNVVGKSLDEARKAIKKAGLTVGKIVYQESDELLPDTVIEQSLEPGTKVSAGDTLDLVVSKLPDGQTEPVP